MNIGERPTSWSRLAVALAIFNGFKTSRKLSSSPASSTSGRIRMAVWTSPSEVLWTCRVRAGSPVSKHRFRGQSSDLLSQGASRQWETSKQDLPLTSCPSEKIERNCSLVATITRSRPSNIAASGRASSNAAKRPFRGGCVPCSFKPCSSLPTVSVLWGGAPPPKASVGVSGFSPSPLNRGRSCEFLPSVLPPSVRRGFKLRANFGQARDLFSRLERVGRRKRAKSLRRRVSGPVGRHFDNSPARDCNRCQSGGGSSAGDGRKGRVSGSQGISLDVGLPSPSIARSP